MSDPDDMLRELRALIADQPVGDEIAAKFEELDAHLSRGGFVPHDWQHRQAPAMIVVDDPKQIGALTDALLMQEPRKIRFWIDGDRVKFKINEHTWSPPMGRIQEPY
ncbi:HNH endonuclease [Mycobacterium phage Barnyard]|uniref:Uncharacterized protein n=1 Tax=Mycobacterium phage Barnyard TaxID=205880 RepID=Q856B9_9CAUD|nr:HNH endonuclease [Mycobacterium phage Barnyard]AAN02107.1 hypothetical protein PBI_BARNYARD_53 [Mycobacterium phage Barnyard]